MAGIWIYSEDEVVAKEMLTLAKELAAQSYEPIGAVTLCEAAAEALAVLGAEKVIVLKGGLAWEEAYEKALAETLKVEEAKVVLIGGTTRGKYIAAKAAARLDAGLITDAVKLEMEADKLVAERIVFGGLAVSTEEIALPALVTIPPHSYEIMEPVAIKGNITVKEVTVESQLTISNISKIERQGVDIGSADRVVGIGRGVGKQEDLAMIQNLADVLQAEIGCTRPISEDLKWFPIDRYIGISGKVIKGSLYVAIGTSGQIQHVSGIRDSKIIVAINTNENEPIFAAADYGIVGSYEEFIPAFIDALKQAK